MRKKDDVYKPLLVMLVMTASTRRGRQKSVHTSIVHTIFSVVSSEIFRQRDLSGWVEESPVYEIFSVLW